MSENPMTPRERLMEMNDKLDAHFAIWPGPDVEDPAWESQLETIEDEIFALRREIKWMERDDEDF
jgi:hypothetical protein